MTQSADKIQPTGSRAWRQFRSNRTAVTGALFLLVSAATTLVMLPFSSSWYAAQDVDHAIRAAPSVQPVSEYETMRDRLESHTFWRHFGWAGAGVHRMSGWMGYDALGRSLFFRCMLGWMISLLIGLAAATMAVTIGVLWGALAAMAGGVVDSFMMRVVDVLYGLPYILLVILLQIVLRAPLRKLLGEEGQLANIVLLVVAIGGVSWLTMSRVVRGQVLALRSMAYVDAARIAGANTLQILWRHLLPNLVGPISVYAALIVPQAILQEAFLSFLGIGIQQPLPSLGRLASDGVQAVNSFVSFWWLITFPSLILMLTLLSLNFLGDGLRDALDPKASMTPAL